MLSYKDILILFMKNMKKNNLIILILSFLLFFKSSYACNLLEVGIGQDKSSIENIFGKIPDSEFEKGNFYRVEGVHEHVGQIESFCEDRNIFGNVSMSVYIVDDIVGALKIEKLGPSKTEDGTKIDGDFIHKYVELNFGKVDTEDRKWPGYKFWERGDKQIFYYKTKKIDNDIEEGVVVTNEKYFDVLLANEDVIAKD